jgi:hypothetical protein
LNDNYIYIRPVELTAPELAASELVAPEVAAAEFAPPELVVVELVALELAAPVDAWQVPTKLATGVPEQHPPTPEIRS